MIQCVKLTAWYSPNWIADKGLILGYGYAGVYNLITEKDTETGARVQRRDPDRLDAVGTLKLDPKTGANKICRYKVQGKMLIDYLQKHNLPVPNVIN